MSIALTTFPPADRASWRPTTQRLAVWCAFLAVVVAATVAGLIVRRWAWDQTEPIRFTGDIDNAYRVGQRSLAVGMLGLYDREAAEAEIPASKPDEPKYDLDYAPIRLFAATRWAAHVRRVLPAAGAWMKPDTNGEGATGPDFYAAATAAAKDLGRPTLTYDLVAPLLWVNTACEFAGAVAVFFIVRRTLQRAGHRSPSPGTPGEGRGEGEFKRQAIFDDLNHPNPNPLPAYREREPEGASPAAFPRHVLIPLAAALLYWFNLALIWNAHCWPQWDSWVPATYLLALLAACTDCWFVAGLVLAVGAMAKGQVLISAPLLLLWPMWQCRFGAAAGLLTGFAVGAAAIASPWLVGREHTMSAIRYVAGLPLAWAAWCVLLRTGWNWRTKVVIGIAAFALLVWPLVRPAYSTDAPLAARATILLALLAVAGLGTLAAAFLPRRALGYPAVGAAAVGLFLCVPLFDGSMNWYHIGFEFGARHFRNSMSVGPTNNLPEILTDYHWGPADAVVRLDSSPTPRAPEPRVPVTLHTSSAVARWFTWLNPEFVPSKDGSQITNVDVPLRSFLRLIYSGCLILCSLGAAIHDSRGSPRFLIAAAAPFVLSFALMTQMHERYLVWGAAVTALTLGTSVGFGLLHLAITLIAWSTPALSQLSGPWPDESIGRQIAGLVRGMHPGTGWAVLLAAAILLYNAVAPEKRPPIPSPGTPGEG